MRLESAVALVGVCALALAACAGTPPPAAHHNAVPTAAVGPPSYSAPSPRAGRIARDADRTPLSVSSVAQQVDAMTTADKVRQLMVPSFSGTQVPKGLIDGLHPGGLIYFGSNLTTQAQTRALSAAIQREAVGHSVPLLLMTDQEGGRVVRIPDTEGTPGGADFHGNAGWAHATAVKTGRLMSGLGVNTNLAPDADVNTRGPGGVIGDRSFGSTPGVVSRLVTAQVCGYHSGGVATTVKHFPGHGSTDTDSHLHTAVIKETVAKWAATDLPPFETAVADDVNMIMVGHLAFPAMDPTGRPATISYKLNHALLRDWLGYQGVVITDALNMGGITSWGSTGEIAVKTILAGSDMLLMPPQPSVAVQAVVAAVQDGTISQPRLDASVTRVLTLKHQLGLLKPPSSLPQCG